jgi:hypothetical protein
MFNCVKKWNIFNNVCGLLLENFYPLVLLDIDYFVPNVEASKAVGIPSQIHLIALELV